MQEVIEKLYFQLEKRGLKGKVVSIQRLQDLKQDIEGRYAQDIFDEDFYRERLSSFEFSHPSEIITATSLIVVAMPRPQTKVNFIWNGKTLSLILPPTYLEYKRVSSKIESLLAEMLSPHGFHVTLARLPLKSLAVRSGLGAYGRNNICYVPGMGSFLQLAACYSDLPCEEDEWREPVMIERCQDCQACQRKCPTQAITSERFLLHAERCIVFHNERPADRSFPDWLDLSSHDCLLGCMYCQRFCPEDKEFLGWFEGNEEFSHEETSLLLKSPSREQLSAETVEKLERLGFLNYLEILPRNLKVVLKVAGQRIKSTTQPRRRTQRTQ